MLPQFRHDRHPQQVGQPLFLRARTADVRNTQSAAVKHTSIADTHRGQGAARTQIETASMVVGHNTGM